MNKTELINKTCETLDAAGIRKPFKIRSEKFTISHPDGDSAVFTVGGELKRLYYNAVDVGNVLDALIAVIEDSMRRGETVSVRGFGTLEIRKAKARRVREPEQEIWHDIPAMYRPKFTAGCNLSAAAQACKLQEDDIGAEAFLPEADEDEDEDNVQFAECEVQWDDEIGGDGE